jgi:hypothetical protein
VLTLNTNGLPGKYFGDWKCLRQACLIQKGSLAFGSPYERINASTVRHRILRQSYPFKNSTNLQFKVAACRLRGLDGWCLRGANLFDCSAAVTPPWRLESRRACLRRDNKYRREGVSLCAASPAMSA